MANISLGWPPADIAAANMQVPVSIRGDRTIDIPVCHVSFRGDRRLTSLCLSTNIPRRQCEYPVDVKSMVTSVSCMKRVSGIAHQYSSGLFHWFH